MKRNRTKSNLIKRKLFRTIFGIFSLSGILFAFQACYGSMQDFGMDVHVNGVVTSEGTKSPLAGIKVLVSASGQYTTTGPEGFYSFYCERQREIHLSFIDTDGPQNGLYHTGDTIVKLPDNTESLTINIELKK